MLIAGTVALLCACAISIGQWTGTPNWRNADSLFYQAMSLELSGHSAQAARRLVFDSALARPAITQQYNVASRRWQAFEAQFFRRRWVVPAMAAALRPLAGVRALPDAAIVGYFVLAFVMAALLASRFRLCACIPAVVLCLALEPVRDWGTRPMTDSWGLVFAVAAVLSALLALRRPGIGLVAWAALMAALSFTRDLSLAPLAAVLWLALRDRDSRRAGLTLFATGVAVTVPAYVVFGASLRLTLASVLDGFGVPSPAHSTWSYIARHYAGFAFDTIKADAHYAIHHPLVGLTFAAGLAAVVVLRFGDDRLTMMLRGWILGWSILFLLDPVYTGLRYEIALVPPAAAGLCVLIERLLSLRAPPAAAPSA